MKTTQNLLLTVIITALSVFGCAIGNAQISYTNALSLNGATLIYSNAFNGSAVTVNGTAPTVANSILGGTNTATWNVISNNITTGMYLYQNGAIGTLLGTSLLPFKPQTNYVYTLTASVTLPIMAAGKWINIGFAANDPTNTAAARFGDTQITGNPWMYITEGSGGEVFFPTRALATPAISFTPTPGTYNVSVVLDTTGTTTTNWISSVFVNNSQVSTNYTYSPNPTITAFGVGQTTLTTSAGIQWNYLTLAATPLVITKSPVSASVAAGVIFTNTVVVAGKAPSYQWFTSNVPIPGATNASLILNPVTGANAGTNYYVVITNSLGGAVTSAPVSLTVYSVPTISTAYPVTYTNVMTLYGGANVGGTNYPGSSPTFSVSVIGQPPLSYQWQTNGVAVGGATSASFTFANCQLNGPTNFTCVVTNVGGAVTNTWLASYLQTPMAVFPAAVLSDSPIGFWRLNERPDDENGDEGAIANDYAGGNNGLYTNVILGYAGYTNTDPTDASVRFNYYDSDSDVYGIQGIDFSNNASATFSVQAWVNGSASQPNGADIIAKGYNGGEQFALDVNGGKYRFLARNAAGTAASVTASTGPDGNWHLIIGVCDEVNGAVSLYVDGLSVGSMPMASGSGVFACPTPVTIGARGSSATVSDDLEFNGYLSDVAAYNYALSAGQVANLWTAAGFSVGFTFIPPLPPTNFVFQANGSITNATITIPATVFGQGPLGYYWTNLTTGTIMGSGSTNVLGNLNATLTVPNAPASLSGDQLELVVTNASNSTNWFTTLFSPPPSVTLDYSSPILYSNDFNGGMWSVAGMPVTAANSLVGGTNTTWIDALGINDTGVMQANGIATSTLGNSWLLPFTPEPGYIYTVTATLTFFGYPGSWIGIGFAQTIPTNATGSARMDDADVTGYDWLILVESTQNAEYFGGPIGALPIYNANSSFGSSVPGTHLVQVTLDTTGAQWAINANIDGTAMGSTTSYATQPSISGVGITQNALGAPAEIQWNSFMVSQVAPGNVAPYLLAPQPSTNSIGLTNATVTIAATAFGSGPLGYYWINNSTVVASGSTNTMAPLPANLSVSSSSLSAGQLQLVVTNAYGTNITSIALVSSAPSVNPNPGPIQFSMTGNQLALGWPTNLGWTLQVQTNNLSTGLGTNWVDVAGSTTATNVVVPITPANGSVFYRLHYQP
jgi:hypothetical protein